MNLQTDNSMRNSMHIKLKQFPASLRRTYVAGILKLFNLINIYNLLGLH